MRETRVRYCRLAELDPFDDRDEQRGMLAGRAEPLLHFALLSGSQLTMLVAVEETECH